LSSPEELCLTVENGMVDVEGAEVSLMPCVSAIAAGDGRELFSLQPNGQLLSVLGKLCVGLAENEVSSGGRLVLMKCDAAAKASDGRSNFELLGNGQIKLGRDGQYCLSQRGTGAGVANVALGAAASASSSADVVAHGARAAVDGRSATYWASKLGESVAELSVDFGALVKVQKAEIMWAYPAKAFAIFLSEDGTAFTEAYATDINVLNATRVPLGYKFARKAKVVMSQPHPIHARLHGHSVYGISTMAFTAARLQTVVEECSKASKSADARDKYFLSYIGEADTCPSKQLRSELPAFEAAKSSLAATTAELVEVLPALATCSAGGAELLQRTVVPQPQGQQLRSVQTKVTRRSETGSEIVDDVEEQNGVDAQSVKLLLEAARGAILLTRGL